MARGRAVHRPARPADRTRASQEPDDFGAARGRGGGQAHRVDPMREGRDRPQGVPRHHCAARAGRTEFASGSRRRRCACGLRCRPIDAGTGRSVAGRPGGGAAGRVRIAHRPTAGCVGRWRVVRTLRRPVGERGNGSRRFFASHFGFSQHLFYRCRRCGRRAFASGKDSCGGARPERRCCEGRVVGDTVYFTVSERPFTELLFGAEVQHEP